MVSASCSSTIVKGVATCLYLPLDNSSGGVVGHVLESTRLYLLLVDSLGGVVDDVLEEANHLQRKYRVCTHACHVRDLSQDRQIGARNSRVSKCRYARLERSAYST